MNKNAQKFFSIVNETIIDEIDMLNNTNSLSKEEFMSSADMRFPNNRYEMLDADKAADNLKVINSALNDLGSADIGENSRGIIEQLLYDNKKRNELVSAVYKFNNSEPSERENVAKRVVAASEALYGKPDEDTFWAVLNYELDCIDRNRFGAEYDELIMKIGAVKKSDKPIYRPSDEAFARISDFAHKFYKDYLAEIPNDKELFTVGEVCDIANRIIEKTIGVANTQWKAVVVPNKTYASTNHDEKLIKFPGMRSQGDYTVDDVRAVLVHELGTHVLRSIYFEDFGIAPLSHGMSDYLLVDEGIAKAMECAVNNKYSHSGILHYISVGLIYFLKMDFREVYETQVMLGRLTGHASPSQCFDSVQRAFRGTGILPNNKDLAYYNGAERIWRYFEKNCHKIDEFRAIFECGKINIFDNEQVKFSNDVKSDRIHMIRYSDFMRIDPDSFLYKVPFIDYLEWLMRDDFSAFKKEWFNRFKLRKVPGHNDDDIISGMLATTLKERDKKAARQDYYKCCFKSVLCTLRHIFTPEIFELLKEASASDKGKIFVDNYQRILKSILFDGENLYSEFLFRIKGISQYSVIRHDMHTVSVHQVLRQGLYGNYSAHSFPDKEDPSATIGTIRLLIELRIRRAFGVLAYIDDKNNITPLDMSTLFDIIKAHKSEIQFPLELENIIRIYKWSNIFIHSGKCDHKWIPYYLEFVLKRLTFGVPNKKFGNFNDGIATSKKTIDAIHEELKAICRKSESENKFELLTCKPECRFIEA